MPRKIESFAAMRRVLERLDVDQSAGPYSAVCSPFVVFSSIWYVSSSARYCDCAPRNCCAKMPVARAGSPTQSAQMLVSIPAKYCAFVAVVGAFGFIAQLAAGEVVAVAGADATACIAPRRPISFYICTRMSPDLSGSG